MEASEGSDGPEGNPARAGLAPVDALSDSIRDSFAVHKIAG